MALHQQRVHLKISRDQGNDLRRIEILAKTLHHFHGQLSLGVSVVDGQSQCVRTIHRANRADDAMELAA